MLNVTPSAIKLQGSIVIVLQTKSIKADTIWLNVVYKFACGNRFLGSHAYAVAG